MYNSSFNQGAILEKQKPKINKGRNISEWKLRRGCSGWEEIGPKWVRMKGKTEKTT